MLCERGLRLVENTTADLESVAGTNSELLSDFSGRMVLAVEMPFFVALAMTNFPLDFPDVLGSGGSFSSPTSSSIRIAARVSKSFDGVFDGS